LWVGKPNDERLPGRGVSGKPGESCLTIRQRWDSTRDRTAVGSENPGRVWDHGEVTGGSSLRLDSVEKRNGSSMLDQDWDKRRPACITHVH